MVEKQWMYQGWEEIWTCWSAMVEGVGAVVPAASWEGSLHFPARKLLWPKFPSHHHQQQPGQFSGTLAQAVLTQTNGCFADPRWIHNTALKGVTFFCLFFTKWQMEKLKKCLMTYLVASVKNKLCTSCVKAMPLPIRPPLHPTDIAEELHWMSHQQLFIFEGLEHMLSTRTQKLRWAAAESNLRVPREGLTRISNPSSHTIFVIGQRVAQWHFMCWFFPRPLWFPPPIWPFVCRGCPLESQLGCHITWDQPLPILKCRNVAVSETLFYVFSTTAQRCKEKTWKVFMAHLIQKVPWTHATLWSTKNESGKIYFCSSYNLQCNIISLRGLNKNMRNNTYIYILIYIHIYRYIYMGWTFEWCKLV